MGMTPKLLLVSVLAALLGSCVLGYPPSTFPVRPRGYIFPISQKFEIAVVNFIDQTGTALDLVEALPDAVSTALQNTQRFSLFDRGQLRQLDRGQLRQKGKRGAGMLYDTYPTEPPYGVKPDTGGRYYSWAVRRMIQVQEEIESLKAIRDQVDAILMASITGRNEAAVTIDYRLVTSVFQRVIYAASVKIPYTQSGGGRGFSFNRAKLEAEAKRIVAFFPEPAKLKEGKILNIRGGFVVLDLGKRDGLFPGLTAFVHSPKELMLHPSDDRSIPEDVYRGLIYVTGVFDETAQAFVYKGLGNLKVGDKVRFR